MKWCIGMARIWRTPNTDNDFHWKEIVLRVIKWWSFSLSSDPFSCILLSWQPFLLVQMYSTPPPRKATDSKETPFRYDAFGKIDAFCFFSKSISFAFNSNKFHYKRYFIFYFIFFVQFYRKTFIIIYVCWIQIIFGRRNEQWNLQHKNMFW